MRKQRTYEFVFFGPPSFTGPQKQEEPLFTFTLKQGDAVGFVRFTPFHYLPKRKGQNLLMKCPSGYRLLVRKLS